MSKKNGKNLICEVCGKTYYRSGRRCNSSRYCSRECWGKRSPKIETSCPFCGKIFMEYEGRKVYCSIECRDMDYRLRFKGEKSHLWEGGKTSRNKKMRTNSAFKAWRTLVFERDNYTCQCCNARCRKGKRVELHPHHILELSKYPEYAYDVENGITLCSDCHWAYHRGTLDPHYCQVIIDRWEKFTGKEAIKLED